MGRRAARTSFNRAQDNFVCIELLTARFLSGKRVIGWHPTRDHEIVWTDPRNMIKGIV